VPFKVSFALKARDVVVDLQKTVNRLAVSMHVRDLFTNASVSFILWWLSQHNMSLYLDHESGAEGTSAGNRWNLTT